MYSYCTLRDVRAALTPGALSTDKETAASFDDWQIEDGIEQAEGIVNAHVLTRYTIPTSEIEVEDPDNPGNTWVFMVAPSPVRGWARDIAAWLVSLTFRKSKDIGEDDPIRLRYEAAIDMLEAIRDRKATLPGSVFPPVDEAESQVGVSVFNLYEGRLFGPEDFGLGYDEKVYRPQVYWPVR